MEFDPETDCNLYGVDLNDYVQSAPENASDDIAATLEAGIMTEFEGDKQDSPAMNNEFFDFDAAVTSDMTANGTADTAAPLNEDSVTGLINSSDNGGDDPCNVVPSIEVPHPDETTVNHDNAFNLNRDASVDLSQVVAFNLNHDAALNSNQDVSPNFSQDALSNFNQDAALGFNQDMTFNGNFGVTNGNALPNATYSTGYPELDALIANVDWTAHPLTDGLANDVDYTFFTNLANSSTGSDSSKGLNGTDAHEPKPEYQNQIQPEYQNEIQPEYQNEIQPEYQNEIQPEYQNEIQPEYQNEIQSAAQPQYQNQLRPAPQLEFQQQSQGEMIDLSQDEFAAQPDAVMPRPQTPPLVHEVSSPKSQATPQTPKNKSDQDDSIYVPPGMEYVGNGNYRILPKTQNIVQIAATAQGPPSPMMNSPESARVTPTASPASGQKRARQDSQAETPSKRGRSNLQQTCTSSLMPEDLQPGAISDLFSPRVPLQERLTRQQDFLNANQPSVRRSVDALMRVQFKELHPHEKARLLLPLLRGTHPLEAERQEQAGDASYGAVRQREALENAARKTEELAKSAEQANVMPQQKTTQKPKASPKTKATPKKKAVQQQSQPTAQFQQSPVQSQQPMVQPQRPQSLFQSMNQPQNDQQSSFQQHMFQKPSLQRPQMLQQQHQKAPQEMTPQQVARQDMAPQQMTPPQMPQQSTGPQQMVPQQMSPQDYAKMMEEFKSMQEKLQLFQQHLPQLQQQMQQQ